MSDTYNLDRFRDAQDAVFDTALRELLAGRKQTHWMWFVFPQLAGLGRSPTAQYYGIACIAEARAYLADPLLGTRLRRCVEALLPWSGKWSAEAILGPVDALKLRSSLTLFDAIDPASIFARALAEFYGAPDERTLALLEEPR